MINIVAADSPGCLSSHDPYHPKVILTVATHTPTMPLVLEGFAFFYLQREAPFETRRLFELQGNARIKAE